MMRKYAKTDRHLLRELASQVYEADAREALASLDDDFSRWRVREIDSAELIQAIHDFHQHGARDLWRTYSSLKEDEIVARGIAYGFIDPRVRVAR